MSTDPMTELAEHYDNTDTSAELEHAQLEEDVDPDPMVTTSVRLPKSLLDWVREQAEGERVRPTALIRRWIEERRDSSRVRAAPGDDDLNSRVQRLEGMLHFLKLELQQRGVIPWPSSAIPAPVEGVHDNLGAGRSG